MVMSGCYMCHYDTQCHCPYIILAAAGEHGGVMVKHRTPNREVLGSIPTYDILLCP